MEKNKTEKMGWLWSLSLVALVLLASCHTRYAVTEVEARRVAMDTAWDARPCEEALTLLAPYKAGVDSVMGEVKGVAAVSMDRFRPESPLSNLIADVLRQAAASVLGRPADVGLVNVGGIRNVLTAGNITTQNIYEILPFENSLCVLTLSGADLKELCANIAARGGEGVSGLNLVISADGRLLEARVGGQPVDEGRTYTVGTIDFLAEGNDGMQALTRASQRQCPEGATLRGLFMDYVERQTAAGRKIEARVEGRVVVKQRTVSSQQKRTERKELSQ